MIVFSTPTVLDIRAATTLGVHVKLNTNPIGFFGTGLKYAIAVLLRERQRITIVAGSETYNFSAVPTEIRGQSFSLVCMNGRELGFTTDFGKQWDLWMAYRELYSNTMDEGGAVDFSPRRPDDLYSTQIIVEGEAFEEVHRNRRNFLFLDEPDLETVFGSVVFKPSPVIFYRGMAVVTPSAPTFYTYNLTGSITLTEERTAKFPFQCESIISHLLESVPPDRLAAAITARNHYENSMDFSPFQGEAFWSSVGNIAKTAASDMNPILYRLYCEKTKDVGVIKEFELSHSQELSFRRALALCERLGFSPQDYPIAFAERIGTGVLGAATNGRILISRAAFDQGAKIVAGTLIEEFIHLRERLRDESREMQNFLLNRLVGAGEELKGESL